MITAEQQRWLDSFEFDANTTKFSLKNAFALGKISWLCYGEKLGLSAEQLETIIKDRFKFKVFRPFRREATEGMLLADDEKIIVAFRGTDSLRDWLSNLEIELTGGPFYGRVHEGFSISLSWVWREVQQSINEQLKELQQELTQENLNAICAGSLRSRSLWFTGHSLGAALATLATAKVREKDRPVHGLYTFGSPRVGDRNFERNFHADFQDRIFRFVNKNDLVTRVPLRTQSYSHVGQLFFIDSQDQLQKDKDYWYRFLEGIKVRLEDIADLDLSAIDNHGIDRYITAIEKNQGRDL